MKIMISRAKFGFRPAPQDLVDRQDRQEGAAGDAAGQERAPPDRGIRRKSAASRCAWGPAHLGPIDQEEQHKQPREPRRRELGRRVS